MGFDVVFGEHIGYAGEGFAREVAEGFPFASKHYACNPSLSFTIVTYTINLFRCFAIRELMRVTNAAKCVMSIIFHALQIFYTIIIAYMVNVVYYFRIYTVVHLIGDAVHAAQFAAKICSYISGLTKLADNITYCEFFRWHFPSEYASEGVIRYDFV